jgi:hypothetical protein
MLTVTSRATEADAILGHVEYQLFSAFDDAFIHLAQPRVALDGLAAHVRRQSHTCGAA